MHNAGLSFGNILYILIDIYYIYITVSMVIFLAGPTSTVAITTSFWSTTRKYHMAVK